LLLLLQLRVHAAATLQQLDERTNKAPHSKIGKTRTGLTPFVPSVLPFRIIE
jgi:hypothetical protein